MLVGYARVSTSDQDLTLQTDALTKAGCEKLFTDKVSGAKLNRPGLTEALNFVRAGDTLVIWKLDRLGRSIGGLIELATDLSARKIDFRSLTDGFDTATPSGRLLFHILASVAEGARTDKGTDDRGIDSGTGKRRHGWRSQVRNDARHARHSPQAAQGRRQTSEGRKAAPSRPFHLLSPFPCGRARTRLIGVRRSSRFGPPCIKADPRLTSLHASDLWFHPLPAMHPEAAQDRRCRLRPRSFPFHKFDILPAKAAHRQV